MSPSAICASRRLHELEDERDATIQLQNGASGQSNDFQRGGQDHEQRGLEAVARSY
jgi:hypothetical protein